jgi:DNA polymerase-3 subunit beta
MKFIINREQLLPPLQQIVGVIEKRQTMPILSNVLMNLDDQHLTLTGTDLEIQMVARIPVSAEFLGAITVPARKFLDICRLLPPEADIAFELKENKLLLRSGRGRFNLSTLPADDYPEFVETEYQHQFTISTEKFKKALNKTAFCMASQDVRYYLNGLLVNISNSKIKMVGSDGHRLSFFEDELDNPTGYEERIILPRKGVLELSRLLNDPETELSVYFSENNIKVVFQNMTFYAKLVDSKYPDFSRVFNQAFHNPVLIQTQLLKDTLTRVSVLANEKFKGVTLDISENLIKISAHNPEHDEAEEELVMQYTGEAITVSFNSQYLLDAVSNLDSEMMALTIAANNSCCFIEEVDNPTYKFIVMSMQL